jgi:transcription antitermination factor NusG
MSSLEQIGAYAVPSTLTKGQEWYALQTRARHEKRIAADLQNYGISAFLPLVTEVHRWSDRRKAVEVPLFSCYVFVQIELSPSERLLVLRTPGVLSFVGSNHCPAAISETEIDSVKAVLAGAAKFSSHPFLKVGQRVRIRGGALNGVEGILMARNGESGLVVSIDAIQRSLLVRIEGYEVEPLPCTGRTAAAARS